MLDDAAGDPGRASAVGATDLIHALLPALRLLLLASVTAMPLAAATTQTAGALDIGDAMGSVAAGDGLAVAPVASGMTVAGGSLFELARQSVAQREAVALSMELERTKAALAESRAEQEALDRDLAVARQELALARSGRDAAEARVDDIVARHLKAVKQLLAGAGVDAEPILKRARETGKGGKGGPFRPLATGKNVRGSLDDSLPDAHDPVIALASVERVIASVPMISPLARFEITSEFGPRRDPLTRRASFHEGLDLADPIGTGVQAPSAGRVIFVGRRGDYGLMVEIDHGMGLTTRYAHLRRVLVRAGQFVKIRQPIGLVGSTGRSTGPHLHYEVRLNGVARDPEPFLDSGQRLVGLLDH